MAVALQYSAIKVTELWCRMESLNALEHLQRENGEHSEWILRVLDQGGWTRILGRTKIIDVGIFMSVSGLDVLIGGGSRSSF